jgi:hypothetical protein
MLQEILANSLKREINKYVDTFFDILVERYQLDKEELKQLFENMENSDLVSEKNYSKMKLPQLKALCKERKITVSKKKKTELVQLLNEYDDNNSVQQVDTHSETSSDTTSENDQMENVSETCSETNLDEKTYSKMKLPELKALCKERKIPVFKKKKTELIQLLNEFDNHNDSESVQESVNDLESVQESVNDLESVQESVNDLESVQESVNDLESVQEMEFVNQTTPIEPEVEQIDDKERETNSIDLEKDKQQLDSILDTDKKDLYSLSRDELKKMCMERGIDIKKKKRNEMIELLQGTNEEEEDFENYLVDDSIL